MALGPRRLHSVDDPARAIYAQKIFPRDTPPKPPKHPCLRCRQIRPKRLHSVEARPQPPKKFSTFGGFGANFYSVDGRYEPTAHHVPMQRRLIPNSPARVPVWVVLGLPCLAVVLSCF
mgnify:CR=1 FL=1